jgi:hypothetical protein
MAGGSSATEAFLSGGRLPHWPDCGTAAVNPAPPRRGVVCKLGGRAAHSLPCAAEPRVAKPGTSLSLVGLRARLSPPFLGASLSAVGKRNTACGSLPDLGRARRLSARLHLRGHEGPDPGADLREGRH